MHYKKKKFFVLLCYKGYPNIYELMYDLKGMGESNCAWNQNLNLTKDVLLAANSIYKDMYGVEENGLVGLPATYQILYFIGWKPDESQIKAAKRGSGQVSLKDLGNINQAYSKK
jgi:NADH dehydrogenase [ubiquinone] 1 alpha subcomplex assembly factor 5